MTFEKKHMELMELDTEPIEMETEIEFYDFPEKIKDVLWVQIDGVRAYNLNYTHPKGKLHITSYCETTQAGETRMMVE